MFARLHRTRLVVVLFALAASAAALHAQSKPNVLIIVADDLGYNDLGFQGCKDIAQALMAVHLASYH